MTKNRAAFFAMVAGIVVAAGAASAQEFGATAGPEHKRLAESAGEWEATMTMFAPGQTEPIMETKAIEKVTVLPGGLWVLGEFKGDVAGQPFEGRSVTGYDAARKKYVGTWVDTMTSSITQMEGSYDEATKSLTMFSEGPDPTTGKTMRTKNVEIHPEPGVRKFTMYMAEPGTKDDAKEGWVKSMEVTYRKKK